MVAKRKGSANKSVTQTEKKSVVAIGGNARGKRSSKDSTASKVTTSVTKRMAKLAAAPVEDSKMAKVPTVSKAKTAATDDSKRAAKGAKAGDDDSKRAAKGAKAGEDNKRDGEKTSGEESKTDKTTASTKKKDGKGKGGDDWVPPNVRQSEFYHGMIHKDELAAMLKQEGDFMIRLGRSEQAEKRVTLTVQWEGKPRHFIVQWEGRGAKRKVWVEADRKFGDEIKLVEWYMQSSTPLGLRNCVLRATVTHQAWELELKDIHLDKELGSGAFGRVWSGDLEIAAKSKVKVAVKQCDSDLLSLAAQNIFMKEAEIGRRLIHVNIIRCWGVQHREEPLMIVMELAEGGSLLGRLRKAKITTEDQMNWTREACAALEYLETRKVIHRDIAARNCLLGAAPSFPLKLADFGLAKSDCVSYKMSGKGNTKMAAKWMAPEVMLSGEFSFASEVWAFGVLVWEIYAKGEEPYKGYTALEIKERVGGKEKLRLSLQSSWPPKIKDMLAACWDSKPAKRPKIGALNADLNGVAAPSSVATTHENTMDESQMQLNSNAVNTRPTSAMVSSAAPSASHALETTKS